MTGEILHGALTLTVLVVGRLPHHLRTLRSCPFELGIDILNTHQYHVGDHAVLWGLLLMTDIGDDHRPVFTHLHLGAVILPDSDPLGKAERLGEPGHRGPHVRVYEYRDDSG